MLDVDGQAWKFTPQHDEQFTNTFEKQDKEIVSENANAPGHVWGV